MTSERLHARLRQIRARAAIRAWEARQIRHARGVWFRLELLLAHSRRALAISAADAALLRADGLEPHAVGHELEPAKLIFVVSEDRVPSAISGEDVPLQDDHRLLLAPALILIPFHRE